MNARQWQRVFRAGADAIPTARFRDNPGLTPDYYPVAAVVWALQAMAGEAEAIAVEAETVVT